MDSDFAGDLDKRKSTTGYVFTLARAAVSWVSKLQTVVALSNGIKVHGSYTSLQGTYLDTKVVGGARARIRENICIL